MQHSLKLWSASGRKPVINSIVRCVSSLTDNVQQEDKVQVKPFEQIPGPPSLPIIGPLINYLTGAFMRNNAVYDLIVLLREKYGPIVKIDQNFGKPAMVILFDPESISQIHRGENWMPRRPGLPSLEYFRREYKTKIPMNQPTGLITDHGEPWKQFRMKVNPVMLQPKTVKLYEPVLEEVADDMVARLRLLRDENNVIKEKIDVEMNLWALESIGTVGLGTRLNCLDPDLPADSPVRRLIQCVHDTFKYANKLDFKPSMWRILPTPTFKKAMKNYEEQVNLTKYFVQKAIEELKTKSKTEDEKGVLEKLLEIDEEVAVIMASDMLFAGVDTAANTVTAAIYLLAVNPDKQRKLRKELRASKESRPYLKACLKEAMRMMPVAGGNMRQTTKEYNILGYHIPKNTNISFLHQVISLSEGQFPEPTKFIPERWIAPKTDPLYHGNAHPFAYSPFGFGVRMCIGKRIAMLETLILLAKVVENFHVGWEGPPPKVTTNSLNYVTGPFHFILEDVEQQKTNM